MSSLPVVAIVGRPNVGKSSLFNALVRSRIAIVDPTAGVTRDRVSTVLRAGERRCVLIDTGGIGIVDSIGLEEDVEIQISIAMNEADLLLFVVDAMDGVMPADVHIAQRLRRLDKPVLLVANKSDNFSLEALGGESFKLGFGESFCTAAPLGRGIGELREEIGERLPEGGEEEDETEPVRLAIVGRANAGKSTLVNRLVGAGRMIVSEIPGTTRDAVDLPFEHDGRAFVAVDTAGMRKRKSVSGTPDFYGQARSERAIRRADVVLFMIDASEDIGRIEKQLADRVVEATKPSILVFSKWDLVKDKADLNDFSEYLGKKLPFLQRVPITVMSAVEDFHVTEVLSLAAELHEQAGQRMSTGDVNHLIKAALSRKGPPVRGGRTGKIYFGSQVGVHPPTFVLFVNKETLIPNDYRRYLAGFLRDHGPFTDVPIRFAVRQREDRHK